ncbi:uncharacterized protein METZ01_LOCUS6457 [marine metagenome]|uniref:Uncharacterized protein n=1 Tax=marine metagenome TaxID=408172 RepID=A0A381NJA7_9ZZZZ
MGQRIGRPALSVKSGAVFEGRSWFRVNLAVQSPGSGFDGLVHAQEKLRGTGVLVLVHLTLQRAPVFHLPDAQVLERIVVIIAFKFEPAGGDVAGNGHTLGQVLLVVPLVEFRVGCLVHFHGHHQHRVADVLRGGVAVCLSHFLATLILRIGNQIQDKSRTVSAAGAACGRAVG